MFHIEYKLICTVRKREGRQTRRQTSCSMMNLVFIYITRQSSSSQYLMAVLIVLPCLAEEMLIKVRLGLYALVIHLKYNKQNNLQATEEISYFQHFLHVTRFFILTGWKPSERIRRKRACSRFYVVQNTRASNTREKRFILAHGFSPFLVSYIALGPRVLYSFNAGHCVKSGKNEGGKEEEESKIVREGHRERDTGTIYILPGLVLGHPLSLTTHQLLVSSTS